MTSKCDGHRKEFYWLFRCFVGWFTTCNVRCVIFFPPWYWQLFFLCLLQMFRKLIPRLAPAWHWPRSTLPHPAFIPLHRSICSLFLIPLSFVHRTIRQPPPPPPKALSGGRTTHCPVLWLLWQRNGGQISVRSRCHLLRQCSHFHYETLCEGFITWLYKFAAGWTCHIYSFIWGGCYWSLRFSAKTCM